MGIRIRLFSANQRTHRQTQLIIATDYRNVIHGEINISGSKQKQSNKSRTSEDRP